MGKHIFDKREFLNKEGFHSNAAIVTNIEKASYNDGGFYVSYKLSDCNRTVELSIDIDSMKEYKNTMFKLSQLIETTQALKDKLEELKPTIKANIVKKKEERKRNKKKKND